MTRRSMDNMAADPRNDYQMLNRSECRRILAEKGIPFDPRITQIDAVILLKANKVNPREAIKWEQFYVEGPDGKQVIKSAPKRTEPVRPEGHDEKALAEVDRLSAIAIEEEKKSSKKIEILQNDISQLKALVTQLIEQKQPILVEDSVSVVVEENKSVNNITDLKKIHWKKFQKMAKEIGIVWTTKEPREPIIEKLESQGA